MDQKAVYPYTYDYVKHVGKVEFEGYQSSLKENIACKKVIEQTIAANFDGMRLKPESAKAVIVEFGYDRVNWVLDPTMLKDTHKTRDEQLFYCTGGFGCSLDASGRKVFGEPFVDGEETHHYREDFIGEVRTDLLPKWAVDKMKEKNVEYMQHFPDTPKREKSSIHQQIAKAKQKIDSASKEQAEVKKDKEVR